MYFKGNALLLVALIASALTAHGEDIDIFSGIQADGSKPNLLFVLDNSGNANSSTTFTNSCGSTANPVSVIDNTKAFGFELCALITSLQAVATTSSLQGNINMGLMLYAAANGGQMKYPSTAPYALPAMDATNTASFQSTLQAMSMHTDGVNNAQTGETMQEAWAFFSGHTGMSGTTYNPHFNSACQRNFVVFIGNATKSGGLGPTWNAQAALNSAGANTVQQTQLNYPNTVNTSDTKQWAPEWTRFNYQTDMSSTFTGNQNIVTYSIIVTDGSGTNGEISMQAVEKMMAAYGGGKTFVVAMGDTAALTQALLQIFNEVQAVNSAFASSSLPVSSNAQGQYLNQVFTGVFRPDAFPRWQGNLKQYKIGVDPNSTSNTILVDANGNNALSNAGTGFTSPNAQSFWTSKDNTTMPDSAGGFWVNNPQGASNGYDLVDGEVVEKGAVHQRIRLKYQKVDYASTAENTVPLPATARQLYTCTTGCSTGSALSATPFSLGNSNITATALSTAGTPVTISQIARSDSTNLATVTLAAAPNPALTNGQSVTISGATNTAFNGTFNISLIDALHFTYPLPATSITPPTPANGTFTVSVPSTSVSISAITRSGATATVTTATAHGYLTGQSVTISGATQSEYNGTFAITNTGANSFTYTVPTSPSTTITAPITATAAATKGASSFNFDKTAVSVTALTATSVNVTITGGANATNGWVATNSVTVTGITPSQYNGTFSITNVGNSCTGGSTKKSFCYTLTTTPASPATGTMTAGTSALSIAIASLTHTSSNCAVSGSYTSSGSNSVLATVTTSTANGLSNGSSVAIGGTPATNEGAYVKSNQTITTVNSTSFTYPVTVLPECKETTASMIATPSGVNRDTLIRWLRGEDNATDEPSPDTTHNSINIRPSVHGDVIHSRPLIVNYGGTTGVIAFYGSNDGVFRAVNGNQTSNPAGSSLPAPGNELWGFIPPEFFPRLNRLRSNSPAIKFEATPTSITPTPIAKDYFFDGSTGVYKDASHVYIYLTARRGGRLIYALDVTDPIAPKLLWKHTNTDTGFSELGQTWSQPKVIKVKGFSNPVMVFGAGYDSSEDAQPAAIDTMGRGIFILDAVTGNIVWTAHGGGSTNTCSGISCTLRDMTYAIPSDVTAVDRDFDGYVDRFYVGDLGGNMWRVDFEPTISNITPSYWQAELLAAVGGTANSGYDRRKIFYPPSIADLLIGADAVSFTTGDREHPVYSDAATSIKNRFYMIKDLNQGKDGSGAVPVVDNSSTTTFQTVSDLFDASATSFTTNTSGRQVAVSSAYNNTLGGFFINLVSDGATLGEKGVNGAVTVGGVVYFSTNTPKAPSPNTCQANLGEARAYAVSLKGTSSSTPIPGGGLPPTSVVATVQISENNTQQICIGCLPDKPDSQQKPDVTSPLAAPQQSRSFWYEKH